MPTWKKLEAAKALTEVVRELNVLDCNVIVCDTDARIVNFVQARTFQGNFKIGEIASAGLIKEVLSTKKLMKRLIPEEIYGVKIKAIVSPLIEEDGTISGVFGTGTSMSAQESLHKSSQSIAVTSEEVTATIEELTSSALQLAQSLLNIKKTVEKVSTGINKTTDILGFVNEIADNSNLLGLNASIEAARAGEHGRGFAVVADKIHQMAINSVASVNDIRKIIQTIQNETGELFETIRSASDLGQQQAAATEEIQAAVQQLAKVASEIEELAEVI